MYYYYLFIFNKFDKLLSDELKKNERENVPVKRNNQFGTDMTAQHVWAMWLYGCILVFFPHVSQVCNGL